MNTFVKSVKQREVVIQFKGSNELQSIPCSVVVWATGIKARPLTNRIRETIGLKVQSNRMGLLTDRYLRVKGVDDGSIFALGDCATIEQPKLADRIQVLFEEADTQRRGALDLQQFKALVEQKVNEYPQVPIEICRDRVNAESLSSSWKSSRWKSRKPSKKPIKRSQAIWISPRFVRFSRKPIRKFGLFPRRLKWPRKKVDTSLTFSISYLIWVRLIFNNNNKLSNSFAINIWARWLTSVEMRPWWISPVLDRFSISSIWNHCPAGAQLTFGSRSTSRRCLPDARRHSWHLIGFAPKSTDGTSADIKCIDLLPVFPDLIDWLTLDSRLSLFQIHLTLCLFASWLTMTMLTNKSSSPRFPFSLNPLLDSLSIIRWIWVLWIMTSISREWQHWSVISIVREPSSVIACQNVLFIFD